MAYFATSSQRRNYFAAFGNGRPLVLLHGITNSGRAWGAQLGPFVAAGFQLIIPDHAGHGASDPVPGPVSVEELADDVLTLLDKLSISKADIVGLSLGGLIAMQLALEAPGRVGRLVVTNSFPALKGDDIRTMFQSIASTSREQDGTVKLFEDSWPLCANESFRQSAEGMRMYQLLHGLAAVADGNSWAYVAEGILGFGVEDRLARLEHETLFIGGAQDTMSPPTLLHQLTDMAPRGSYVELPQAAHVSNMDSAPAFNKEVLAFLSNKR